MIRQSVLGLLFSLATFNVAIAEENKSIFNFEQLKSIAAELQPSDEVVQQAQEQSQQLLKQVATQLPIDAEITEASIDELLSQLPSLSDLQTTADAGDLQKLVGDVLANPQIQGEALKLLNDQMGSESLGELVGTLTNSVTDQKDVQELNAVYSEALKLLNQSSE